MRFSVITLFPEMFESLSVGITGRAIKDKLLKIDLWNPRDYARDKHKTVDSSPYGGGPGMVMMPEPLQAAIHAAKQQMIQDNAQGDPKENINDNHPLVIYLSPQGQRFNQAAAEKLAARKSFILIAGRYEGIDQRIIDQEVDQEWSIGDYILTGGELPAMVMIDTLTRLIPGAIGDQSSVTQDSISSGLLKYPQYTRPEVFNGLTVPDILLSGHHQQIKQWRLKTSLGKTWLRRPDLLAQTALNEEESRLLAEFIQEFKEKQDG